MGDRIFTAKAAIVAGAALALAACNGGNNADNVSANDLEANMSFDAPANDASAMEAAGNATEAPPPVADNAADNAARETEGGDTGGNNVESNVSGM